MFRDFVIKKLPRKGKERFGLKVPEDKTFEWTDLVGNKKISFAGQRC